MTNWSKVGKSSRSRGHAFERKMAKVLSKIFGVEIARTPCSGGHVIVGDLYQPEKTNIGIVFYCRIEKGWSWDAIFQGKTVKNGPKYWASTTDVNSAWLIRTSPNCFYLVMPKWRLKFKTPKKFVLLDNELAYMSLEAFEGLYKEGLLDVGTYKHSET